MKNNLASNLKYLRKKNGKSQTDIGLQLKKAHTSIGNWEKGISEPSLSEIEEIASFFEITPSDLLFEDLANVLLNHGSELEKKGENVLLNVPLPVLQNSGIGLLSPQNDLFNHLLTSKEETIQAHTQTINHQLNTINWLQTENKRLIEENGILKRELQKHKTAAKHTSGRTGREKAA